MTFGFVNDMRNLLKYTGVLKNYKICTLRDIFFQVYITEEVCVITLKGDTIFKEKLTGGLKNDIKNLVNFHGSSRMWENLHFDGFLLSTAYKVS